MTTKEQEELARETYRKFCAIVGPKLTSKIQHPAEGPSILPKGNHDRVRIRILPLSREATGWFLAQQSLLL